MGVHDGPEYARRRIRVISLLYLKILEAEPGIEPRYTALQAAALI